jgi:hypothetical protein
MAINPLQAPINYAGMVPQVNIAQQFAEFGQVLADRQKRIQADEVKKVYATDLQAAIDNPTQEAWSSMIAKYPQQREAFAEARKGFGEAAATNEFNQGFEVSMALENNNPEVATARLMKIISARETAGMPTGIYKQTLNELELGNTKGAQAGVNYALSMADPDRFQKQVNARVTAAKAPSDITEAKAKADKALSDATTALATADNAQDKAKAEAVLATAQADKAKVDADYALYNTRADLEKKAADLGLTKAQTGSALAQTIKLGQETAKIALDLEALKASGGVDPAKKFEQEEKLRKEYQGRTKVYGELGTTYQNMKSSADAKTGPGDIALITGFMKMLDPGSVVRETEFATARDTSGLYERLKNQVTKLESGQLFALDSKQRQEYVTLAKQYLESSQKKAGEDKKALGVVVKNYSLNPENVFGPETAAAAETPAPSPNTATVGDMTYTRPANFTDKQWADYKQNVGAK